MGLSNGKGNVSSTLTFEKFIQQLRLVRELQLRSTRSCNQSGILENSYEDMNLQMSFQGG